MLQRTVYHLWGDLSPLFSLGRSSARALQQQALQAARPARQGRRPGNDRRFCRWMGKTATLPPL